VLVAAEDALAARERDLGERAGVVADAAARLQQRERAVAEREEFLERREALLVEGEQAVAKLRNALR
jgi:uncharacterized protein (DUF3084 family)